MNATFKPVIHTWRLNLHSSRALGWPVVGSYRSWNSETWVFFGKREEKPVWKSTRCAIMLWHQEEDGCGGVPTNQPAIKELGGLHPQGESSTYRLP